MLKTFTSKRVYNKTITRKPKCNTQDNAMIPKATNLQKEEGHASVYKNIQFIKIK